MYGDLEQMQQKLSFIYSLYLNLTRTVFSKKTDVPLQNETTGSRDIVYSRKCQTKANGFGLTLSRTHNILWTRYLNQTTGSQDIVYPRKCQAKANANGICTKTICAPSP